MSTTKVQERFIRPSELCERWNVKLQTLAAWRCRGGGPRYVKIGKSIRYPESVVEEYEARNTTTSTSAFAASCA